MAIQLNITATVVKLADFRCERDAAVAARAAMDRAETDAEYHAAADRQTRARPTTLEGARVKLHIIREALDDLQAGDTFEPARWNEVVAALEGADSLLAALTSRRSA